MNCEPMPLPVALLPVPVAVDEREFNTAAECKDGPYGCWTEEMGGANDTAAEGEIRGRRCIIVISGG
jgi:hypothetical protein